MNRIMKIYYTNRINKWLRKSNYIACKIMNLEDYSAERLVLDDKLSLSNNKILYYGEKLRPGFKLNFQLNIVDRLIVENNKSKKKKLKIKKKLTKKNK